MFQNKLSGLILTIQNKNKLYLKLLSKLVLITIALILHLFFSLRTPVNIDEPVYIIAGYNYATYIQNLEPQLIFQSQYNTEHPAFTKLIYGGAIWLDWQLRGYLPLLISDDDNSLSLKFQSTQAFNRYLADARLVSSLFGITLVIVLTSLNPIAGIYALISTTLLRYTTLAYLEAPGLLFSTIAIVIYSGKKAQERIIQSIVLIGISTGLATAAKYYYGVIGIIIFFDLLLKIKIPIRNRLLIVFMFVVATMIAFSVANPPFWTQGISTLINLLQTNGIEYRSGWSGVIQNHLLGAPSVIPLFMPPLNNWNDAQLNILSLKTDSILLVLAFSGLIVQWCQETIIKIWFLVTICIIIFYPVKYPQYNAIIVIPACICAASATKQLWRHWYNRRLIG